MTTATAMPTPSILYSMALRVMKTVKTTVMMTAALVTTPALPAIPPVIASRGSAVAAQRSRIRLRMKMW
ncbi:UNVERIFIED_ORG: hypothetical protein FHR35_000370 [Microbispora rosea subsp. rosea]